MLLVTKSSFRLWTPFVIVLLVCSVFTAVLPAEKKWMALVLVMAAIFILLLIGMLKLNKLNEHADYTACFAQMTQDFIARRLSNYKPSTAEKFGNDAPAQGGNFFQYFSCTNSLDSLGGILFLHYRGQKIECTHLIDPTPYRRGIRFAPGSNLDEIWVARSQSDPHEYRLEYLYS